MCDPAHGSPAGREGERPWLNFERNTLLTASAGTGKTESLVALYAHLVAGALPSFGAVRPQRIVAVTFTERAAAEMRERLGATLFQLASFRDDGSWARTASLSARWVVQRLRGKPDMAVLHRAASDFLKARVCTWGSYCAALLRQEGRAVDLHPGFTIDDEVIAREHIRRCCERVVQRQLVQGDRPLMDLFEDLGCFYGVHSPGLVDSVLRLCSVELPSVSHRGERAASLWRAAEQTQRAYREDKRRRGAVDFRDLGVLARRVLRDVPEARRRWCDGTDVLFVDEFQDSNRLQRDLVHLLRADEDWERGVPPAERMRPRGLFVVGDAKQSIYGFRDADVGVLHGMAASITAIGGVVHALRTSYRSAGPLVRALNAIHGHLFDSHEYQPARDSLLAAEGSSTCAPAVHWVCPVKGDDTWDEFACVAEYVRWQLDKGTVDDGAGGQRPVCPGDVALLLPRFTRLHAYLRALDGVGVGYGVVHGRGLFDGTEARDVLSLCRVLLRRDDRLSMAAVLRSPLVAVSDGALRVMLWGGVSGKGLGERVRSCLSSGELSGGAGERVLRFLAMVDELAAVVTRAGLYRTVRRALHLCGYERAVGSGPAGAQRADNVRRVLAHLRGLEMGMPEPTAHGVLERFERLSAESLPEADAESGLGDADSAVRVMTVHQSKGLQFPVVVAADLGRGLRGKRQAVAWDREMGLAVASRNSKGKWDYTTAGFEEVHGARCDREERERRRLFYVQSTRAQERLCLVGRDSGLMGELKGVLEGLDRDGLARRWTVTAGARDEPMVAAIDGATVHGVVPPLRRIPALRVDVPVTQLQDHDRCRRRFLLKHVRRLHEHPNRAVEAPQADPAQRGTQVHAVLESMDFHRAVIDPEAEFDMASRALGLHFLSSQDSEFDELRARVMGFLRSDFFHRMVRDGKWDREVPFVWPITVKTDDGVPRTVTLRGQMDLVVRFGSEVWVVDHKVTSPGNLEKYGFQMGVYAEAFGHLCAPEGPVTTAVQFLDGQVRDPLPMGELQAPLRKLESAARHYVASIPGDGFERLPLTMCRSLDCGYRWFCH